MRFNLNQINRFTHSRGITEHVFSYDIIWEDYGDKKYPVRIMFYKEDWTPYKNIFDEVVIPTYPRREMIKQEFDYKEFLTFINRGSKLRKILQ